MLLNRVIARQSQYNKNQSTRSLIYKTIYDQESTQIKLKQCLILPTDITTDPNRSQNI